MRARGRGRRAAARRTISIVRGVGPARRRANRLGRSTSATRARCCGCCRAGSPGRAAGSWTLDGDESIRRRPVDRVAEPLRRMGAQRRVPRRPAAAARGRRARELAGHPLRAAGRERAGQVVRAAGRAARGRRDDRGRAAAEPRPHRADAARSGRAARRRESEAPRRHGRRRCDGSSSRGRRARRLLVGRLLHRGRDARARLASWSCAAWA